MKPITTNGVTFFKREGNFFISEEALGFGELYEFGEDRNLAHLVFLDYVAQIVNEEKEPQLNFELKG